MATTIVGSQETPGVTGKFGLGVRNEAGQRLIEFCQENALVIANTLFQQHKRRLYTCTSPDGQHRNQIDYILCSQGGRSSIHSAKTRLGADCDSDHELLIAKFRLKMKKVGKNTRPFRYDLNQIPYDYIVEEAQAGFKIAGRNINNLRYADDTTLMAECEEELKRLLMKVKEESGKSWLKAQHSEN